MDNLFDQTTGQPPEPTSYEVPSYLLGADNHNLANQGDSWFDPTTWGDRVSKGLQFGAVSVVSGGVQLYNSGSIIGSWAGLGDGTQAEVEDVVSGIDSDLGEYYKRNQQSADVVGFVAGSFVPGLAGVKVLNAGQSALRAASVGKIGTNLSRATGLLAPETGAYITAAAQEINAASATFSALNQSGIKALMAGVGQQALEGAAFEVFVQGFMFKSPILDQQTGWDITKNILTGGVLGGVVGGAFVGASTYGKIMSKVKGFQEETAFARSRALQQELNSPSLTVIRNAQDIETSLKVPDLPPGATAEEVALHLRVKKEAEQKLVRTLNDMRENTNLLAKGADLSATNMVADTLVGMPAQKVMEGMLHADEIVRPGVMTQVEKDIAKQVKAKGVVDKGLQINYVKLTGDGAGDVITGTPLFQTIADTVALRKGGSLMESVLQEVKGYKFRVGALWDARAKTLKGSANEAEARYIWAARMEKETFLKEGFTSHINDLPVLEAAFDKGAIAMKLVDNTGQVVKDGFGSSDEMWKYIVGVKEDVATSMATKYFKTQGAEHLNQDAIAKIVNTKIGRIDGSLMKDDFADYRAWQSYKSEYQAAKKARGLPVDETLDDPRFLPSYAKVTRRVPESAMADANGHVVDGATWIKTQEKIHQEAVDRAVADGAGELYGHIQEITEDMLWKANPGGAGAKVAAFASGGYGSLESTVQALGSVTSKLQTKFREATQLTLEGPYAAMARNLDSAVEYSTLGQKATRSAKQWAFHEMETGENYLISPKAKSLLAKGELQFDEIDPSDLIRITTQEAAESIKADIARTSERTTKHTNLQNAQGKTNEKNPEVWRPARPNPKDYPAFAFVKDDKVTGQGHTTMIFAADQKKLQQLGDKAEAAGYRVHYKSDSEDFHRAYGDYEYQRTLHESYIDSDLVNKGIYSEFYTKTDPQKIVNDSLQQHLREDDVLAMELMRAKNQKAFDYLEDQGKAYSRIEASKFGGSIARVEKSEKNPYLSYIKTALNISKASESGIIHSANKFLDESVSRAVGSLRDVFSKARSVEELGEIDKLLTKHGMNTGYRDAALDLLVNHTAPKGELTKFVQKANSILATLTLGLDPVNSLVNAIGANVLRGTELTQLVDSIKKGNTKLAGELAGLAKIDVTGKGDLIMSPAKLYAKAQANFFGGQSADLIKRYTDAGYMGMDAAKFHGLLDDLALKGTESVADMNSRVSRAFAKAKELGEKGRTLTGNKFTEDYNRFVSADVMRQLTDLAESHGLLTRSEAHSYINTFVNRVDGVTVASQRPLMFQGPLGNAIGLFQSYQFNMMQNLFRYSSEGKAKDVAMLMGLQGTFFGVNGLPAFQYINQHIIGTASGNKNHVDLYDATYGAAGKQMGDLLMYGLPSNLLQANLYSRGDINPRSLTIIPTQIKDIPFVSGFMKFTGSMKEIFSKTGAGGDVWSSFLQGMEHNGISRPLAGLAQTLEATGPKGKVYSTTNKGSIIFENDLMSLATLTRLAGARPIDETIVSDGIYRVHSYQQHDRDKMNNLSEAVKSAVIAGRVPEEAQVAEFAAQYAKSGGKQGMFNRWMMSQMTSANTPEANKIVTQLQNPFAQKVQVLMGGAPLDQE